MINYEEQIQWIDYQLKELSAIRDTMGFRAFNVSDEYQNYTALSSIKYGYQKARDAEIEYGWVKSPDMMGR